MSLSWREQITVTLSPNQVEIVRRSRGFRPVVKERLVLPCRAVGASAIWQPALEALRLWLSTAPRASNETHVVLSNHFARYLLIPWKADLVTEHEEIGFARARFLQVFGDVADNWVVKLSRPKPTAAAVASAVERPLLDSVTAAIADSGLRLRSIQPGLMAAFNARTRQPAKPEWMVVAEPGRMVLGLLSDGEWQCLRSRPLNGDEKALAENIEREQLLAGVEPVNARISIHRLNGTSLYVEDLNVEHSPPEQVAIQAVEAN